MANERITENLVRDLLEETGYYNDETVLVEEQRSQRAAIKKMLQGASKTGKSGVGAPEFIITTADAPDFVVVIECKADVKYHESPSHDRPKDFAVDGALHYARALSRRHNVVAIGVSGQSRSGLKLSSFVYPRGSTEPKELITRSGRPVNQIIPLGDLLEHASYDEDVAKARHVDLMAFSRDLHDFMRDHAKLSEAEKPLLVSGTLIALRNPAFASSFHLHKPEKLQREWMRVIKEEFESADIPRGKKASMTQPYSSIAVHPELGKETVAYPRGVLNELIELLKEKVYPYISVYHDFDVVGQFYGEFLKYTGGDKKALGIVLTPRHITELFSRLANVQKDSRVLDLCAGTGGFLISAMHQMFSQAKTSAEREEIKSNGVIGVEQQPSMYTLAASNMILRGDGKANLHQGSCFDAAIVKEVKSYNCNVGMLNPPYAQGTEGLHELFFVKQMLDCLIEGGMGIAIVPMSCAIAPHPMRGELLNAHTLEAVMSMPDALFTPVGVVTCIMVFRAHVPHEQSDQKTWFGYWKDDGFVKVKHRGRIDLRGTWQEKQAGWVEAFRNRDDIPGESVKYKVTAADEWCAEAYMETDYSRISKDDFEEVVRNYALFNLRSQDG